MVVKVPQFLELSASRVYAMAMVSPQFVEYLPEYECEKPINRTYLFNVSDAACCWCDVHSLSR
jgi:hypothetical protein